VSPERKAPDDRSTQTRDLVVRPAGADRRGAIAIALLATLASVTSLVNGFTYDDRLLILDNPRVHHLAHLGRLWAQTYWPPWMGAGLYRPLTMSAFMVEWTVGGGAPWVFHATNVALYILASVLVYGLARLLLPRGAAWIAAALFAVHPVHVEAVANVVGQSELWAACGVLGAVVAFVRWRRLAVARIGVGDASRSATRIVTDDRSVAHRVLVWARHELGADVVGGVGRELVLVALVVGACLAKEHAVVTPALLAGAELLVVGDPRPIGERWRALRPFALMLIAAILAYVAVRAHVIGALAGDRPNVVLEHLSPVARRWTMLGVVTEWVRLLAWPSRLVVEYAPREITIHEHFDLSLVPNAVAVVLVITLLAVSVRRWPAGAFALLWMAITLLLVSNLVVPTGELLAERMLFLPSAGAMLLVGATIARLAPKVGEARLVVASWRVRGPQIALAAILALLLAVAGWRSARRQLVWRSNATLFAQAPVDAPLSYRGHDLYAGLLFDRGDNAGGEHEARIALALYPHDPVLYRDLAQEYMRAGLCPAAIPLLRRSIAEQGTMETDARLLLAECLLAQHDPASARDELLHGVAQGYYPYYGAGYHKVLAAVDTALSHGAARRATSIPASRAASDKPVVQRKTGLPPGAAP